MAESGRRRIGERTREAMAELKARGVESGTPDDLTPDARLKGARDAAVASKARAMEEMSDVAAIAAAMGARGLSPRDIADRLNADGYLTRQGAAWTKVQVKRVLGRAPGPA